MELNYSKQMLQAMRLKIFNKVNNNTTFNNTMNNSMDDDEEDEGQQNIGMDLLELFVRTQDNYNILMAEVKIYKKL